MKKRTQIADIKKYLETHKNGITSLQALEKFGALRLGNAIYVLRKSGLNIITESMDVKNRYGGVSRVARYKLVD